MTSIVATHPTTTSGGISSPLDFLASLANEQQRTLVSKKTVTNADLAVSPSLYLKALCLKSCPHISLPLRPNASAFVSPCDIYDMEVSRAVRACDLDKMRKLHAAGKSFDASNRFGESLLHMACRRGNARIVKFLIEEAQVQVNVRDDMGRSCLHDACWTSSCNYDVMDVLMKVLPPEFWVMEDNRGHTPFDYVRREHWGPWLRYLRKKQPQLVRNFAFL